MSKPVIVVGGGIAGLTAAIYLARGGRKVTLFEKRKHLGGRAVTHLRRGFRFNLGPHAVARRGIAAHIYRELGIPVIGRVAKARGVGLFEGREYTLPVSLFSILTSSLLDAKGKAEVAKLLFRLRSLDTKPLAEMTVRQWLDSAISHPRARALLEAVIRLATYSAEPTQIAAVALEQLKVTSRGVIYVDEGWQKLVDALYSRAVTSGVNFVTSARVIGVRHDGRVQGVELGGLEADRHRDTMSEALPEPAPEPVNGTFLEADDVILAVDPSTAHSLVGPAEFAGAWAQLRPATLACLDVALARLPDRRRTFALGIDKPLYFSVHSAWAQLTPRDGALIHAAKYRPAGGRPSVDYGEETARPTAASKNDETELEALLDQMQPGWRELVVHRRFFPAMTATNAVVTPAVPRPPHATAVRGLYLAGDWVGEQGALSDAALASARAAAKSILG